MYKLVKDALGETVCINKSMEDDTNISIPLDPDNTDYQQYLKWVEEGNTPLPADEGAA
jgi:hypothetical protein